MHPAIATGIPPGVTQDDIAPRIVLDCRQCGAEIDTDQEPTELEVIEGFFCDQECAAQWVSEHADELVERWGC